MGASAAGICCLFQYGNPGAQVLLASSVPKDPYQLNFQLPCGHPGLSRSRPTASMGGKSVAVLRADTWRSLVSSHAKLRSELPGNGTPPKLRPVQGGASRHTGKGRCGKWNNPFLGDEFPVLTCGTKMRACSPMGTAPMLRASADRSVRCNMISAVSGRGGEMRVHDL